MADRRRFAAPLAGLAVIALAVGACGARPATLSPAPPPSSVASAAASPSAVAPTPVPGSDEPRSPSPAAVGQTDTDWGRIWDSIPAAFPRYPGSVPTETGAGPVSAEFSVPVDAPTAAAALQSALEAAAFSTEAQSGPLEDGTIVIDSIGEDPACRVETRLSPLGGTTHMTVLYGAACPAP